jgi:hypothetical protein
MSCRPLSIIAAIISVSSMLLASPTATAQAEDNLIDLGAVAPGRGINNNGEVVLANYFYSQGTLAAYPGGFAGESINASGHVAGFYGIYYYGTVTALPNGLGAIAINDSGAVVILNSLTFTETVSDLYSNGTLTGISIPAGIPGSCEYNFTALAMNDSEQITGIACGVGSGEVVIYDATTKATTDLGIIGSGRAINASGEVTGTARVGYNLAAFLYSHGKVTLLPGASGPVDPDTGGGCQGNAINASGFIVGTCPVFIGYSPGNGGDPEYINQPFVYNGTTRNLNALVRSSDSLKPYVTLTDANGINDSGLVIVNGTDSRDNAGHAYLMQLQLIKVSIFSSASNVAPGTSVTLTWATTPAPSNGVSCTATGGSAADGWTGEIALNGKKTVTESSAGTYSYGVSCTVGSQKQQADTSVVVTSNSGGGAFDSLSLSFLIGMLALRRLRKQILLGGDASQLTGLARA